MRPDPQHPPSTEIQRHEQLKAQTTKASFGGGVLTGLLNLCDSTTGNAREYIPLKDLKKQKRLARESVQSAQANEAARNKLCKLERSWCGHRRDH
jgi:hypothetical protein